MCHYSHILDIHYKYISNNYSIVIKICDGKVDPHVKRGKIHRINFVTDIIVNITLIVHYKYILIVTQRERTDADQSDLCDCIWRDTIPNTVIRKSTVT